MPAIRSLRGVVNRVVLWGAVLALWHGLVVFFDLPAYILPSPVRIAVAFAVNFFIILEHSVVTVFEILAGLGLAIVGAVFWALVIVSSEMLRRAIYPLMVAAQASPKEALAPLFILWFGFTMTPKVLMAAIIAFFPILVSCIVGLERFDDRLRMLARIMGASRIKTLLSFRAWVALPAFFGSLRLGVTLATVGAVIGEFLGSDVGIGYLVLTAARRVDGEFLYASLVVLVLLVLALVAVVDIVERRVLKGVREAKVPSVTM